MSLWIAYLPDNLRQTLWYRFEFGHRHMVHFVLGASRPMGCPKAKLGEKLEVLTKHAIMSVYGLPFILLA